jgi:hypothetical protein
MEKTSGTSAAASASKSAAAAGALNVRDVCGVAFGVLGVAAWLI